MPTPFRSCLPSPLLTAAAVALLGSGAATAADSLQVGLILAGSQTDGGWNQLAKEAIDTLAHDLHAKVSVLQKVTPDKAGDEMRGYANDGYQLVICHGYEFLNPAATMAASLSTTHFAVSGADVGKPNLVSLDFDLSQASYEVGILAARMSTSGKLGFIGGSKIPSVEACFRGFAAGAKHVRPDIVVTETFTSWDQPEKSKAEAEALMQQGVDGIFHDVDAASRGIFEAIAEHNQTAAAHPVHVYGSVANQNANPVAGTWMPASAVIHLDQAFEALAREVQAGSWKPGVRHEDLGTGTCVLVLNPTFVATHQIAPSVQQELSDADAHLRAGTLTVPAAP